MRTTRILNTLPEGYRHTILAMDGNTSSSELLSERVQVEYVAPDCEKPGRFYAFRLSKRLRALRPDLLLTYNWGAMDAVIGAALRRIRPWIHVEDGFGPDEAVSQKRRRVWTRRVLLRGARAVVVPSYNLLRIATETWRISPKRVLHIPNGIDCARFSPGPPDAELRARLGIREQNIIIGTVAHLRGEKDPLRLLEAFASHAGTFPSAHLVYVGSGDLLEPLRTRARSLGLGDRIHFTGHVNDPIEYYRLMDIFALSSRTEQMPLSVVEAMAVGAPVLSTAVGDVRDMVSEPNRPHIVALGSEVRYREAMGKLLADAELRTALGDANRERALDRYQESTMLRTWRDLFEQHGRG